MRFNKHIFNHFSNCLLLLIPGILLFTGCGGVSEAQKIVDLAIAKHGGAHYDNVFISFDFRDRSYSIEKKGGEYEYTRLFKDSIGDLKDYLSNEGFYRTLNGEKIDVVDTMAAKYANSVNSVVYFAMTPFVLNDPAVKKENLGMCSLKGEKYHKIQITFAQEEGGKDFDDVFVYWFNAETYTMDYFAYVYHTDGGGNRFREIYNRRRVGEILFSDQITFKYDSEDTPIHEYDQLYEDNQLTELSRIELKNIEVKPL